MTFAPTQTVLTHAASAGAATSCLALWDSVAQALRARVGENNHRSWILPLVPLTVESGVLTLAAPTRFVRDWVRTHYEATIRELWAQQDTALLRLDVVVAPPTSAAPGVNDVRAVPASPVAEEQGTEEQRAEELSAPLDPRYSFDRFVAGPASALAFSAACKFAQSETVTFNPLYIHGAVGLGKTHLLQAAAAAIRAQNPRLKVVYMSAERFMYRFVQSLRRKDTMAFKAALRAADVLLFDDLQFICGKEATQDEFLSAFNALLDDGKRVAVVADRSPVELDAVGERLRSRLSGGLVVKIDVPSEQARLDILRAKCTQMGRAVPDDVLGFLAARIDSNVRELEGALNRVVAQTEMSGVVLDVAAAQGMLGDLLRAPAARLTIEDIQKAVAGHYGISVQALLSPARTRVLARPRQVAMYLAKALTAHSLPEIGRRFGGRDHTTILHGIRTIESLASQDQGLAGDLAALRRALPA